MTDLVIAHLYPYEMNIYGDTGNVIALRRRLEWRGMEARIDPVPVGAPYDFARADLVTEMREVKHYYAVGVEAREGIEF